MLFRMFSRYYVRLIPVLSLAVFALAANYSAADDVIPRGELPDACHKAKAEFRMIGAADVEQSKTELFDALERLDRRLALDGQNGADWRSYLAWDELQTALKADKTDPALLRKVHGLYAAGYEGLDLVWFIDVRNALHNYVAMLGAADNPAVRSGYEAVIDRLAVSVKNYIAKPTTDDAQTINESVRWLENAHQCSELVKAINHHLVRPNLFVEITAPVAAAGLAEKVDDTIPIRDCILGTDIYGTAHTAGGTRAELWPDERFAVIDALFFGTTDSENIGYNGPVAIYSRSTIDLAARKRIWIDADGLKSYPAVSRADASIEIDDIRSHRGRRIIERMAWRRAGKQQCAAEQIAAQHAEERLNNRIDQQAAEPLEKANRQYNEKYRRPFSERKLFPERLDFSTTDRAIAITGLQAGGGKLAAPSDPPSADGDAEMSVRVHESMINNLAFDALAGRTVYEAKVQALAVDLLGELPEKMKGDADGKPWAITFDQRRPVTVSFADGRMSLTVRGIKFYKGDDAHPAMNISAVYKIEKTDAGFKFVREGEIEVFPPDFDPKSGKKIDARRSVIRNLLADRFENVFEQEFIAKGFEMPGKWKSVGWMKPIQLTAEDGWLVISWKRSGQ